MPIPVKPIQITRCLIVIVMCLPLLQACSDSDDNVENVNTGANTESNLNTNLDTGVTTNEELQLSEFQLSDFYIDVVLDSFQPEAIDQASGAVYEAQLRLNNQYFSNFSTEQLVIKTPITDTFDCDSGTVTRVQSGNPVIKYEEYEFDNCQLQNYIHNGTAALTISSLFNCNGPDYELAFDSYSLKNAVDLTMLTGEAAYTRGAVNCASAAGGPPGGFTGFDARFSKIETTIANRFVTYTDFALENNWSEFNLYRADTRLEFALQAQIKIQDQALPLTISTVKPVLISDGPEIANTGALLISTGIDASSIEESLSYTIPVCHKNLTTVTHTSKDGDVAEISLEWLQAKNVLNKIPTPSLLMRGTVANPINFTNGLAVPYSENQNIEGC